MKIDHLKENIADKCHEQWSGWMEYLFSKCEYNQNTGEFIIPKWAVERWTQQMNTDYKDLTEEEKNSDRIEAEKFIKLVENENEKTCNCSQN